MKRRSSLLIHIKRIHKEPTLKCPHCEKLLLDKRSLKIHIMDHTGERPFKCSICDDAFKTKAALKGHQSKHKTQRLHDCQKCGYSFKDNMLIIRECINRPSLNVQFVKRVANQSLALIITWGFTIMKDPSNVTSAIWTLLTCKGKDATRSVFIKRFLQKIELWLPFV